jgi:hypothetical protein
MGVDNIRIHQPAGFRAGQALRERHEKLAHRSKTRRCCRAAAVSSGAQPHRCDHGNAYQKAVAQLFDQSHDQFLHPAAPDMRSNWMCRRVATMRLDRTSFGKRLAGYNDAVRLPASRSWKAACAWSA